MTESTETMETATVDNRRKDLRDFRKRVGMDLRELAKRTKISYVTLSQFETGARNLSAKRWQRVQREIMKIYHKPPASMKADPVAAQGVREIVVRFQPHVGYPALIRRYNERAWQQSRDNRALAESLKSHLKSEYWQYAAWLEAEVAYEDAKQRCMKAAEIIRSGYGPDEMRGVIKEADGSVSVIEMPAKPYEFPETMALMACEYDKDGMTAIPWQRKLIKAKPETRVPEFEVRIAHSPAEEESLIKAGWQLVKSE